MELENIPQNIKDSLFSERVDETLDKIREESGIFDTSLIPSIYYGLISKEIPAHYFVESLAETGIGEKIAKSIAKAIKERILESERFTLFKWGVDISEIKVEDAPDLETLGLKEFLKTETASKTFSLEDKKTEKEIIPIIKTVQDTSAALKTAGDKKINILDKEQKQEGEPLILQEKESPPSIQPSKKISPLSLGQIGFFKSKKEDVRNRITPLIKIKAEIKTPEETKKVVHYSENKTNLNPWGNESFIKTEPVINTPEKEIFAPQKTENKENEQESKKEDKKSVNILEEKNVIDLRTEKQTDE